MPKRTYLTLFMLCTPMSSLRPADLARVAILTFEDRTGTKNYGYLPQSLTEAVDKSLQKKFQYVREDPAQSDAAFKTLNLNASMTPSAAADFARRQGYDIVIYGSFALDATTATDGGKSVVVVSTAVAFRNAEKFRKLRDRANPADATIFSLAEKVADDIVTEMTTVAKEQAKDEKPAGESGKLELKKESKTPWEEKRRLLSLEAGFTGPMDASEGLKNGFGVMLRFNQKFWRGAYFGGDLGYSFTSADNSSSDCSSSPSSSGNCQSQRGKNFDALYLTGVLGYALYPGTRWRIFFDLGAGPAYGGFREDPNGSKIEQARFMVRAASGVDILIIPSVSLGLGMRLASFPSSGESYTFAQPGLRFAYVF
jgi:hypothetical protein